MKGMWVGYGVGCTMRLTLGHGAWQIDQPSNGSMWNSYSFQPVGQWMGYSFTDLGAEGCCRSLNALFRSPGTIFMIDQFAPKCLKWVFLFKIFLGYPPAKYFQFLFHHNPLPCLMNPTMRLTNIPQYTISKQKFTHVRTFLLHKQASWVMRRVYCGIWATGLLRRSAVPDINDNMQCVIFLESADVLRDLYMPGNLKFKYQLTVF